MPTEPISADPAASPLDEGGFRRLLRQATLGLAAAMAGPLLALLALVLALLLSARWVEHTERVIECAHEAVEDIWSMITGLRGFQYTGDERSLEGYDAAGPRLERKLQTLAKHVADNPEQVARLESVRADLRAWRAQSDEIIARQRVSGAPDPSAFAASRTGINAARGRLMAFITTEKSFHEARQSRVKAFAKGLLAFVGGSVLVGIPLIVAWQRRRLRRIAGSYRAHLLDSERFGEELRVTLASIGDAVVTTDATGRVTFVNAVAARLSGWETAEARGRPFAEVLALYHENTGEPAESPVERVLRAGVTVGLANHTVLRSRAGDEIPIEDSAAPIRAADGVLLGVVIVFRDVTEQRAGDLALVAAKDLAESASRAKDGFLAALSHELRTPLTPALLTAAALREDTRLPDDAREQLGMMERNIALEARLIDDLLDLTRVEQGKLTLRPEPCDMHALIRLSAEMVLDEAREKGVTLDLELAAARSGLTADATRLQQVVWNLLRNAVKFTPRGGRVVVRTADLPGEGEFSRLRIEVADTGIGIEPEARERIFRAFEQLGSAGEHRFGGLGLGLSIARAIVNVHQGTIRAESAGPGQGSTFVVELPGAEEFTPKTAPAPRGGGAVTPVRRRRILLVEDHYPTLSVLTRLLTRAGHRVTAADSVASALEEAGKGSFDIVLSDLGLPDGTGHELMMQLRDRYGLRGIALSGYGMEQDLARSREAGFVSHLVKPVDFGQLSRALEALDESSAVGRAMP